MAKEQKRPPFIIRPTFLLFCLYVIVYVGMRHREEIVVRAISLPAARGSVYLAVTPNPTIPFWRQQIWRAVFSFGMVVEEEGRKLAGMGEGMAWAGMVGGLFGSPASGGGSGSGAPQRTGNILPGGRAGTAAPAGGGGGLVYPSQPGGLTTDQIIDNQIRLTEMTSQAVSGLNPGEQLIHVAPQGETVQRVQ